MADVEDASSVRVAVRIRPQLPRERIDNCRVCTSVTPGEPQVVLGNDKAFTFDQVFDVDTQQDVVFTQYAQGLIDGCFDGYNATILAYGQTGSGKTYSMGTGFDINTSHDQQGIIPRAVNHLFDGVQQLKDNARANSLPEPTFQILAQFMELYNEDIYDLFDPTSVNAEGKKSKSNIKIHEDANGSIYTQGVASKQVNSYEETMECLRAGALSRTTASTNMNSQSSRSHAIFTLLVKQTRSTQQPCGDESKDVDTALEDFETLSAKFNFVDLAGSERLKRTGATGDRAKEGISINCGLLALGNVISALGDANKKGSHVPYRDSKLTRLLQDSLGGNSRTVMIACISPSDRDFMETLNTLKYANRARNIKNKVVVNQDKTSKQLTELRAQIQTLQVELAEYKQGKRIVGPDGVESINDMFHENSLLQVENDKLRSRVKALQETVDSLTSRNASLANEKAAAILNGISGGNSNEEVEKLVAGYTTEVEILRTKLLESEAQRHLLNKETSKTPSRAAGSYSSLGNSPSTPVSMSMDSSMSIIELAKRDVEKSRKMLMSRQSSMLSEDERNEEKEDSGGGSGGDESGEQDTNAVSDDEVEEEMGEGSSTESSDESDRESDHLQEDLAELSGEISLKQRMIEELEKSQRQLQNIRQHYEDKLRNLQNQIEAIERERDQVLGSLGSKKQQSEDQVRKVKSEYEKRLTSMQAELNKVNAAKKEHAKMMKNQAVYDRRIKELSGELNDMKKTKVRLMAQMKTESEKNKRNDQQKSKELIQLKKEKRMRDNQLRMLELQNRQKDAILKRKHEEVSQLRKKQRDGSASSRVLAKNRVNLSQHGKAKVTAQTSTSSKSKQRVAVFSPKVAKSKWDKLEHYITSVVVRKQTISSMEAEMDLHICKREELSKKIDAFSKRLDAALHRNDTELALDLEDQLETMTVNMNYIQGNVSECQNNIMQMEEEAKDETALSSALNVSTVEESKYLLDHLLSLALSQGFDCTQKESQYRELFARYEKMQMDSRLRDQLLEQVLQDSGITLQTQYELNDGNEEEMMSGDNSCRSSPVNGEAEVIEGQLWAELTSKHSKGHKARKRTSTASELLLGPADMEEVRNSVNNKPSINIADIIPPAPKGPPPGRGHPPPIDTIIEEEESEQGTEANVRSGSYTVLNSVEGEDTEQDNLASNGVGSEVQSSSGTSSPDIESSKLLSGSYTILNGEMRLSKLSPEQGDTGQVNGGKKVPPPVPPKPKTSSGPIPGSTGMSKWKGIVSSHLDEFSSSLASSSDYKPPTGASHAAGDQKTEPSGRDTHARVIGRRKLAPGTSPSLRRKTFQPSTSKEKLVSTATEGRDVRLTPPSSPSLNKRRPFSADSDSSNVFMRLTNAASTSTKTKVSHNAGSVNSCEKVTSSNSSMVCVKKAVGHTKAVLSICVADQLLISGSKDLTCKVWDLTIGSEVMSLQGHPNYVTKVRYCPVNRLIYTVANSFVKIWDMRSGPNCIKVLSSSGLVHDSIPVEAASSSAAIIQQGEQPIFDIQVSGDGQKLYTTTGTTVRLWDLNMYSAVGKIASGHQAPIICLSLYGDSRRQSLITGSKDHLIKLFDLSNELSGCLTQPKFTLDPPHYDGVQCFAHRGNTLFSGSRDMCIKKWDLGEPSLQPQLVNGAHKGWIMDMGMLPDNDVLVSCCRSGAVKLWSTDTCNQLDDVKAHSSAVNCMATNNSNLFTASSDGTVKIWWVDPNKLSSS